ncbi:MAG: SAM-dependent chlorinase/fluorinase [Prevotellaceae bacterium]|jgi:S-adenosylmethionine hydrolase|nr:SAM-dependent chlorinase/fluorinase [Prevotellaceae bacterium]
MPIVTITSDWSQHDYYAGSLKGAILARCQGVEIVDLSHQIRSFDVVQSIFIVRHSFGHFPSGTIHLLAVQSEPTPLTPMVIVQAQEQYFVGINDGRFSLLFDETPETVLALPNPTETQTFAAMKLFPQAVAMIVENRIEAESIPSLLVTETASKAAYDSSEIIGRVVYVDSYGNAITNIPQTLFNRVSQGRPFEVFVRGPSAKLNQIAAFYDQVATGEMVAIFNTIGFLEIALNKANLSLIENIDTHSEIRIRFYEQK